MLFLTQHFKDRVDEYLNHYEELADFSYTELAQEVLNSTTEVTLNSGNQYRICELKGVAYGVGIKLEGENITAATLISPLDVEQGWSFKGATKVVNALNS